MEKFYKNLAQRKHHKVVEPGDFADAEQTIDKLLDEVFAATFKLEPDKSRIRRPKCGNTTPCTKLCNPYS